MGMRHFGTRDYCRIINDYMRHISYFQVKSLEWKIAFSESSFHIFPDYLSRSKLTHTFFAIPETYFSRENNSDQG